MEENKLLEKLWSEAQSVEVPPELEPEQIRARIEKEGQVKEHMKGQEKKSGRRRFHWSGYGGRVAAAAVVLVASLGAFTVAGTQTDVPIVEDISAAEGASEPGELRQEGQAADETVTNADGAATEADIAAENAAVAEPVKTLGEYRLADSYGEVCEMLSDLADERKYYVGTMGIEEDAEGSSDEWKKEAASDLAGAPEANVSNSGAAEAERADQSAVKEDFSTTNLQVTGVDESDIVKTDGHYIYIASEDQVQIVDASADTPRQLGSITPELSGNMDRIREMYVSDGRLLLIIQTEDTEVLVQSGEDVGIKDMVSMDIMPVGYAPNRAHTMVLTYDITSPAGAKPVGTFTQDGSYNSSRKIGDQLYLFTDYGYPVCDYPVYPYIRDLDAYNKQAESQGTDEALTEEDVERVLPQIQGETIPEDCIYLPKEGTDSGVVISSVNVKEPEKVVDQKLIFSGYSTLYVTKDSIILYRTDYSMASDSQCTNLTKFAIGDGKIRAACAEAVPGSIEDTFAIHENSDGYVYVLTTDYAAEGMTNQLFVLDEQLKIYGKIKHIADGENVYAARFVDDIGYFVTYRNMDPLFTVDFSDPANPTLIGELEIPGFSDYLQFWDDTHLIGVGEERGAGDSEFIGIKVSLYDISDPTDVKESAKIVMDDACYAPAQYEYKALLADSSKNVIAFLTEDKGDNYHVSQRIFTVQDGKLKKAASDTIAAGDTAERDDGGYYSSGDYRNLYIGDHLYLVREGLVIVYDMTDGFARTAACKLT